VPAYDVAIYCPDRHLVYDGRTPDRHGVGGGVTARIRLARALAALGHRVTLYVNCPQEATYDRVRYVPWNRLERLRTDVLVLNTSGGAVDLRPILDVDVDAGRRIVWLQGARPMPGGLHETRPDFVYAPSNFILRIAQREWALAPAQTFVAYNAADAPPARPWLDWRRGPRDPYRLVYTSHPSKGLDAALGVLRILRGRDVRHTLHVYGGPRLWGEQEMAPPAEPGVVYHGLTGQAELARALRAAGISLNLQAREEPLPLAAIEAMRGGCIVLASPVGGYPEIVRHGHNGFLVPGDPSSEATWRRAADLVSYFVEHSAHAWYLRHNATSVPWDWNTMARTWVGHWDWLARKGESDASDGAPEFACRECGGRLLALADGYHCLACGVYSPEP
jgi:glycosyltransferase involved in cell wall biosynthesis